MFQLVVAILSIALAFTLLTLLHYNVLLHIRKDYRTVLASDVFSLFVCLFVLYLIIVCASYWFLVTTFNI